MSETSPIFVHYTSNNCVFAGKQLDSEVGSALWGEMDTAEIKLLNEFVVVNPES